MTRAIACALAIAACAAHDVPTPVPASAPPRVPADAAIDAAAVATIDAPADAGVPQAAGPAAPSEPRVWLRGSTHVHARPSGDSSEPIPNVIAWYEQRGYDFIVLTDHNQVSEVDKKTHTTGVAIRAPEHGLIVFAGSELTHNPSGCLPAGDKSKKCRIHVNALGVTGRPTGKLDWANRKSRQRLDKYESAFAAARRIGATLVQINHPQWFWGMTGDLLAELATRGAKLVEIANVQFPKWNAGDATHPAMERVWDDALATGATIWGVASDDAHDYSGRKKAQWPAGGGWIVVHARRDPQAILDAIAAGQFYASTGVELARAEVDGGALVVELAASEPAPATIAFVENGAIVATTTARTASRPIPTKGYVRAVITRGDGKQAWTQPARP